MNFNLDFLGGYFAAFVIITNNFSFISSVCLIIVCLIGLKATKELLAARKKESK